MPNFVMIAASREDFLAPIDEMGVDRPVGLYTTTLFVHSILRWVVLGLVLAVLVRSFGGWRQRRDFTAGDQRLGLFFVICLDLQLLIGLLLYFWLSPITALALHDFGGAMKEHTLRFFAVEHSTMMLLAVIVAHMGNVRARKFGRDPARHRVMARTALVCLVLILSAIPWPGLRHGRPLLRSLSTTAPMSTQPMAT
jgi:uncharacterized membrane protein YozB (DUF420 family)